MITSFSSFPVYALQGFGATPFSVPLLSRWWSRGKEEGEGEKSKGQEKGKGKAPRRRGRSCPPGTALLSLPLSPPLAHFLCAAQGRAEDGAGFPSSGAWTLQKDAVSPPRGRRCLAGVVAVFRARQAHLSRGTWSMERRFVSRRSALALQQKQYCWVSSVRLPRCVFTKDSSLQQEQASLLHSCSITALAGAAQVWWHLAQHSRHS